MPPVGQGANMALLDGALLGLAVSAHPDDLPAAVEAYEGGMLARTAAAARQSAYFQDILLSPDTGHRTPDTGHRPDAVVLPTCSDLTEDEQRWAARRSCVRGFPDDVAAAAHDQVVAAAPSAIGATRWSPWRWIR
jgi:2-polyprenyl-6-methoxyphenol hydroxylase-like FAD-dependent oxidoreductase